MKKEENGKNNLAPPSSRGPEKTNPNPDRYDPRHEDEKKGIEEMTGIDKEFGS